MSLGKDNRRQLPACWLLQYGLVCSFSTSAQQYSLENRFHRSRQHSFPAFVKNRLVSFPVPAIYNLHFQSEIAETGAFT